MTKEVNPDAVQQLLNYMENKDENNFKIILENYLKDTTNENVEDKLDLQKEKTKGPSNPRSDIIVKKKDKIKHLSTNVAKDNQTLMQWIAQKGLDKFAEMLLKEGINPNLPDEAGGNERSSKNMAPILLAAKYGHSGIISTFKNYNRDLASPSSQVTNEKQNNSQENVSMIMAPNNDGDLEMTSTKSSPCNFAVSTSKTKERVLHLLLQQPILQMQKACNKATISNVSYGTLKQVGSQGRRKENKNRQKTLKNYDDCLKVMLQKDEFSHKHEEQLRYYSFMLD